jgi:hypothetical protein
MGNRYRAVVVVGLLFLGMNLAAQEPVDGESPDVAPFFPINRLWRDALGIRWQPDWPLAIPPDSFDPVAKGTARRVTITVAAVRDESPDTQNDTAGENNPENAALPIDPGAESSVPVIKYTMRLDSDGRLVEFPFLLSGRFYQAFVEYNRQGTIETMVVAVSPAELTEITFLQTDEGRPVTARIKTGDAYFFASFRWTGDACVELWTDETGLPLEIFRDERIFHYDSMQNITFIYDGTSEVSAFYNANGVRYWATAGKELSFQRDETGLIVRATGAPKNAPENVIHEPPVSYSYEYQFDQSGNWTERREIRWLEIKGYLAPTAGTLVTRLID